MFVSALSQRALTLTAVLFAALLFPLVPDAQASTYPGANGAIAFIQSGDIYTVQPDGTELTNLTNGYQADADHVSISPDGRYIAFSSSGHGDLDDAGIYVMNMAGGGLSDLTSYDDDLIAVGHPTWSPDGSRLAFEAYNWEFKNEMYVVDVDGGNLERITNCNCVQFSSLEWSPVEDKIAFQNYEVVWTIDPDTGATQKIMDDFYDSSSGIHWSPDGTRFVYDDLLDIWTINADGTNPQQLTHDRAAYYADPAWSPDGTEIVIESNWGGADQGLFAINATTGVQEGGTGIREVYDGLGAQSDPDWGPACEGACDFVNLTLIVKKQKAKIKAGGSVVPAAGGQKVKVELFKLSGDKLKRVGKKTATLKPDSSYAATFDRPKGKACAVRTTYNGDAENAPATTFVVFKC